MVVQHVAIVGEAAEDAVSAETLAAPGVALHGAGEGADGSWDVAVGGVKAGEVKSIGVLGSAVNFARHRSIRNVGSDVQEPVTRRPGEWDHGAAW